MITVFSNITYRILGGYRFVKVGERTIVYINWKGRETLLGRKVEYFFNIGV